MELAGAELESLRPERFRPAKSTDVNFGLPPLLRNHLKRSLTALPEADLSRCELCDRCVRHCPPEAMAIRDDNLIIDYKRCIGCFCCQELCPKGAILTRQGLLLRLKQFLKGR